MDENDIIKKLEAARLPEFRTEAQKAAVKSVLFGAKPQAGRKPVPVYMKFIAAMGMFALAAVMTYYVIDNMNEGSQFNRNGGVWSTYSDAQQGGDSVIWPEPSSASGNEFVMSQPGYGETGYAVRVTGRSGAKLGLNYNYLGVVNRFSNDSSCPKCSGVNIKKYRGIMFKVKGRVPSGNLSFILPYEGSDCIEERLTCRSMTGYADYEKEITRDVTSKWTTITIDFRKDLNQPYWTPEKDRVAVEKVLENVHLFKWQYKNGNGDLLDLWIDDVELY
jgi:hypothetical protein